MGRFWCYSKISEFESNIQKKKKKDSNKKSDFGTTAATVGSKIKESKVPYVVKDLSSGIP